MKKIKIIFTLLPVLTGAMIINTSCQKESLQPTTNAQLTEPTAEYSYDNTSAEGIIKAADENLWKRLYSASAGRSSHIEVIDGIWNGGKWGTGLYELGCWRYAGFCGIIVHGLPNPTGASTAEDALIIPIPRKPLLAEGTFIEKREEPSQTVVKFQIDRWR